MNKKKVLYIGVIALCLGIISTLFLFQDKASAPSVISENDKSKKSSTINPSSKDHAVTPDKQQRETQEPTVPSKDNESSEQSSNASSTTNNSSSSSHTKTPPKTSPTSPPVDTPVVAPPIVCLESPGGGGVAFDVVSAGGVQGTRTEDMRAFSEAYNAIRAANCLDPISPYNFRYDSCLEDRLFWMAEDPSEDPASAWGHNGVTRSDDLPIVGCDGNLAGGNHNTGEDLAQKWWNSVSHRLSIYRPSDEVTSNVCIYFAMTHGGLPNEPETFKRAAARWGECNAN